jgi:maltose-binding protein MalE
LLLGPTAWGWAYAQSGLVTDLSAFATPEFLATINPAAVDTLYLGEQLIGLPYAQQGVVLYRNASLIPQAAGTFDALLVNAQNATGMGKVGAYLERESLVSSAILNMLGGRLMDSQGRPAFNSDAGLAWFGLLSRYADAGVAGMHTNRDLELFEEGKIGVIIEGTWHMSSLVSALGPENLAIDPWPAADSGQLSGYVQTEAVYLNTNTPQQDQLAALRFMGYLLNRDVQSLLGESGLIPTVLQAAPRDVHVQQAMLALQGGVAWPMVDEAVLQIYWNALDEAINHVFDRGVSPATALQSAYDVVIARLDDLGGD